MAPALLTFALAASPVDPFADAFWHKDLASLVALLAEPGIAEEDAARALFGDLVRLVNCEMLPPIPSSDTSPLRELRQLVRLERARRSRLGAAAASSRTLWRDILSPGFFNRSLGAGPDGTLLLWPVESEHWSAEELRARVSPSGCAAPPGAPKPTELELASEVVLLDLSRQAAPAKALRPAAARLAYQRAVLLARAGQLDAAKAAAAQVLPAELLGPDLARYGLLLRLELGVDPPEGYAALMGGGFGANQPAVDSRLAYGLHRSGSWEKLRDVTAAACAIAPAALCGPGGSPVSRDLVYRHAVALEKLGASDELDALLAGTFPPCAAVSEPAVDALKDLAITTYARKELDLALEGRLKALNAPGRLARDVQKLGARALHSGNMVNAQRAMGWLITDRSATARARGWVLEAEIAFALQDGKRFDRAVESIFPKDPALDTLRPREREERDRAVEELAQSLVDADADASSGTGFQRRLRAQLPVWRDRAALKREPAFNALLAALESKPVPLDVDKADKRRRPTAEVAVGEIPVAAPDAVPAPPPVQFDWPEPYSLLAIPPPPSARGTDFGAWFTEAIDAKR